MRKNNEITEDQVRHVVAKNQEIIEALKNLNNKLNSISSVAVPIALSDRMNSDLNPIHESGFPSQQNQIMDSL
jgi:hypothetical protein